MLGNLTTVLAGVDDAVSNATSTVVPVQGDTAAIEKAACGVDPPVVKRSDQVADCEARSVSSFAVNVVATSPDLAAGADHAGA